MDLTVNTYNGPARTFVVKNADEVVENQLVDIFKVNDGASYTWSDFGRYKNRILEDVVYRYEDETDLVEDDFIPVLRSCIIKHMPYLEEKIIK